MAGDLCQPQNSNKLAQYQALLMLSYDDAVSVLLNKYGGAEDDYFRESSFIRAQKGEIKSITKGKISRTSEGLYCHHIDENKYPLLSEFDYVSRFDVPFSVQKKERLVYCDLIEHSILHALIAKETDGNFGYAGYILYLEPMVREWFIEGIEPKPNWMKRCKEVSYLSKSETEVLLKEIDSVVLKEIRNREKEALEKIKEIMRANAEKEKIEEELLKEEKMRQEILLEEARQKKLDDYQKAYPELASLGVYPHSPRQKLLNTLHQLKYKTDYTKKELKSEKITVLSEDLFEELKTMSRNGLLESER